MIEFFPKKHPNLVNKEISKIRNLKYSFIRSDYIKPKVSNDGDILVNLKKLNRLINLK